VQIHQAKYGLFSTPDGYYTPYLDNNGKTPYFAKDNSRETGRGDEFFGNGELNFKANFMVELHVSCWSYL
jgi:hypothetical protein